MVNEQISNYEPYGARDVEWMKEQGISFRQDVTAEQLLAVQRRFPVHFPEELMNFYQTAMPVGEGFPDWLDETPEGVQRIRSMLAFPVKSLLMDVELDETWPPAWGKRPDSDEEAVELAGRYLEKAPALIPVYRHRYLVDLKTAGPLPVLSVYGSDILPYGNSLREWMQMEFVRGFQPEKRNRFPVIPVWDLWIG